MKSRSVEHTYRCDPLGSENASSSTKNIKKRSNELTVKKKKLLLNAKVQLLRKLSSVPQCHKKQRCDPKDGENNRKSEKSVSEKNSSVNGTRSKNSKGASMLSKRFVSAEKQRGALGLKIHAKKLCEKVA